MKRKTLYKIYKNGSYPTLASKNLLSLISSGGFSIRPLNCSRRLALILAWNKMTRNSIGNKGGISASLILDVNETDPRTLLFSKKCFTIDYTVRWWWSPIWTFNFPFSEITSHEQIPTVWQSLNVKINKTWYKC